MANYEIDSEVRHEIGNPVSENGASWSMVVGDGEVRFLNPNGHLAARAVVANADSEDIEIRTANATNKVRQPDVIEGLQHLARTALQ